MPKSRRIILAVILVAVVGGGFAAVEFILRQTLWPGMSLNNLTRLEVVAEGKTAYAFYKDGERWMVSTPAGHCRGNEERIKHFAEAVEAIGKDREAASDDAPPAPAEQMAQGLIVSSGAESWRIAVDSALPEGAADKNAHVTVSYKGKSERLLVDARFIKLLALPVTEYADLRLFDLKPERITRLAVNAPGAEEWDLARVQEGVFRFLKPQRLQHVELAQVAIEFYLYAVTSMRSPDFLQDKDALEDPLPEKLLEVQIWSEDQAQPETLVIYHHLDTEKFGPFVAYSSRQEGYLSVPAAKVQQLGNSLLSLRNHPILPQGIGQVDKVMLTTWSDTGEPRQYIFIRTNEEWRRSGTNDALVGMDALIWRLGTMQTDGKNGESAPKNPVRLMRWDFFKQNLSTPVLVLSFSNEQDKDGVKSWVQVGPEGPWFPLQSQAVAEILGHLPTPLEK